MISLARSRWHGAILPLSKRSATAIEVDNYGEAAALDLYGKGLPPRSVVTTNTSCGGCAGSIQQMCYRSRTICPR